MKNFILLVVLSVMSSGVFAGDCLSGSCRQPVRRSVSAVVDVTRNIVTAPVKATKNVLSNVQSRRFARRNH